MREPTPPTGEAMGYLEVSSYVAAVLASDAMSKTARVRLEAVHKASGGLVCVYVRGLIADCRESIAAGRAVAARLGALVGGSVLGRPDEDTVAVWTVHIPAMKQRKAVRKAKAGPDPAGTAGPAGPAMRADRADHDSPDSGSGSGPDPDSGSGSDPGPDARPPKKKRRSRPKKAE